MSEILSERKKNILKAVIEEYISSGEPIGSKFLASLDGISLSPATLRNEMSELTEIGTNLYDICMVASDTNKIDTTLLKEQAERLDKVILQINTLFTVPEKIKGGDIKWQQQKYGT